MSVDRAVLAVDQGGKPARAVGDRSGRGSVPARKGSRRMMDSERCLVTGGAGTIGSTIVDQLLAAGAAEVIVLDNLVRGRRENLSGALESGRVRLVEGDIRDRQLVTDL